MKRKESIDKNAIIEGEDCFRPPFRLGIIGVGSIGVVHYNTLTQFDQPYFTVTALADPQSRVTDVNIPLYPDYRGLLQNPTIQAVSINTPPNMHYQMVIEALEAGKDVLVEKPVALSVADCEAMIALAQDRNHVLFAALHAQYTPCVQAAKQILSNQEISTIDITFKEDVMRYHDPHGWIFDPKIGGGGALIDSGINALSIATLILPEEIELSVLEANFTHPKQFKVETGVDLVFAFGQQGKGRIKMDWLHKGPETRQVIFRTKNGDRYVVDTVSNNVSMNGKLLFGKQNEKEIIDPYVEYRDLYNEFGRLLSEHISSASTKELTFILKAYQKGNYQVI